MAIIPSSKYSGQTTTGDPGYPEGKAKNVTVSGDGTGTPLEADWVNDLWGFLQALLDRAGISASGNPDKVGTSDYLDSLVAWIGTSSNLVHRGFMIMSAWWRNKLTTAYTEVAGVHMQNNGVNMYIVDQGGGGNAKLLQYTLSTPYKVDTASQYDDLDINAYETTPRGLYIDPQGTRGYFTGGSGEVRKFTMTSNDLTTASIGSDFFDFTGQFTAGSGLTFSPTGHKFWVGDAGSNTAIHEYSTATDWTVAGANYEGVFSISSEGSAQILGLWWDETGQYLFVQRSTSGLGTVYEYSFETAHSIPGGASAGAYTGRAFAYGGRSAGSQSAGLSFAGDGRFMYTGDGVSIINGWYTGMAQIE